MPKPTVTSNLPPMHQTPALDMALLARFRDRQTQMMTGRFVLVKESEFVTDPVSGTTYCTQAGWDALKAGIPLAMDARANGGETTTGGDSK